MRLAILVVIILFLLTACSNTQINEEEKELLVPEADFEPFINNTITQDGNYKKTEFSKGEIIEYTSEGGSNLMYLSHYITIQGNLTEAIDNFDIIVQTQKSANSEYVEGKGFEEIDGAGYGDQTKAMLLLSSEGKPIGNSIVIRRNETVHNIVFSGVY